LNEFTSTDAVDGVIKFCADHIYTDCIQSSRNQDDSEEVLAYRIVEGWRQVFWRLELIGQQAQRYGGAGYGNISRRLTGQQTSGHQTSGQPFLISASQTGGASVLDERGYACVDAVSFEQNRVQSRGYRLPSSESLTHAAVYAASADVMMVVHVHSPAIWTHYAALSLSSIPADVAYGTGEMARAIGAQVRMQAESGRASGAAVMLGHEDGVISWGTMEEGAAMEMIRLYALAQRLVRRQED
jgi:ribulose-5-phosphate 4-epimerase/fuculose-1-phosphate aldolase